MRLLLDTHTFLWFTSGDERTSARARSLILDAENDVLLSVASLWEVAIKSSIGKLTLAKPFGDLIPEQIARNAIDIAPITLNDLTIVSQLPFHHRDPFDRLIIAQAMSRGVPVLGSDSRFSNYEVVTLW